MIGGETWSGGVKKRWATTTWQSDNAAWPVNPHVTSSTVYDSTSNYRTSTISYVNSGNVNLPSTVSESGPAGLLRYTTTTYNGSANYRDRRIIGLPAQQLLYDAGNVLAAKVEYLYDDITAGYLQSTGATVTQHDTANYGTSFYYRGNLTTTRRYDVTNGTYIETGKTAYNTTGSAIFSRDAAGHQANFSYTDSFSDNLNHNTYAYPTTMTDPDGYDAP